MNKKEEKKQIVMNLSCPFLELDNNETFKNHNYPESGVYFVKSKDGLFHLCDVDNEDGVVNDLILSPKVGNSLMEQYCIISARDEIVMKAETLYLELKTLIEEKENKLENVLGSLIQSSAKNADLNRDVIIVKLEELVEALKSKQEEDGGKKVQGYVSESALVDILRTIK